jgi:hypothetical protein
VATESSRTTREQREPDRLTFHQTKANHVTFQDEEWQRLEQCHNLIAQVHPNPDEDMTYAPEMAMVFPRIMSDINSQTTIKGASFAQQYIIQCGLKKFRKLGANAATKEIDQLHRRNCFTPVDVALMTPEERRKSVDALMFLAEKRDKSIKGRMVYNGKPTQEWLLREDSTSPTAALESIMLTAIVDAKEDRDVMTRSAGRTTGEYVSRSLRPLCRNGQTQESYLCTSPERPIRHVNLRHHMVYETTK